MNDTRFPELEAEVLKTLTGIFRYQNNTSGILELLNCAHAHFEESDYDNWNGGTYTWEFHLEVPVAAYAQIESRVTEVEKEIAGKLNYLEKRYPNNFIGGVTITPASPGSSTLDHRMVPTTADVQHLWPEGKLRLFLSHLAKDKIGVTKLKNELSSYGVEAFVAHKDIKPSRKWCEEIELGLRSMHALAALITPDFHQSDWTDQEIGWALGRGIPVIPARLGRDPYGFFGKYQGISGTLDEPKDLAAAIVKALLDDPQTHAEMRRALAKALLASTSYGISHELRRILATITDLTEEDKTVLWKACAENSQVFGARYLVDEIYRLIGKPPEQKAAISLDDDIPF